MANKSIQQLPNAAAVSTDELEKQVTAGGASQKMTVAQLLTFIQNNATAFTQALVAFSSSVSFAGGSDNIAADGSFIFRPGGVLARTFTLDVNGNFQTMNGTFAFNSDGSINFNGGAVTSDSVGHLSAINDIEITDTTKGLILKSPNGTRFRLQVDNGGNLGTVAA